MLKEGEEGKRNRYTENILKEWRKENKYSRGWDQIERLNNVWLLLCCLRKTSWSLDLLRFFFSLIESHLSTVSHFRSATKVFFSLSDIQPNQHEWYVFGFLSGKGTTMGNEFRVHFAFLIFSQTITDRMKAFSEAVLMRSRPRKLIENREWDSFLGVVKRKCLSGSVRVLLYKRSLESTPKL